jgi:glycosyltransferase involved in cell wall biosynthesis
MTLRERAAVATAGARQCAVLLSANPMHDTGGGQRSAQLALELLDRGFAVLFVSHGEVTETVDLGLRFDHPRLVEASLREVLDDVSKGDGVAALDIFLGVERALVLTQVPVREWEPALAKARAAGAVTVYDCIDLWNSELGRGWYRRGAEEDVARRSTVLVASAPELVQHVELMAEREAHLLPNAYNSRIFRPDAAAPRPEDLPQGGSVALYVGALWGGWLDWDLVRRAAEALPETRFVFVGDHRKEGRGLPANCVFLGLRPQRSLPGYLAHADVAFLPWSANAVTQATSPLKIYEFVAMGLPVVAPALETLRGIPGVMLTQGEAGFIDALRETRRSRLTPEVRAAMSAFAARSSWVQRVDELLSVAWPPATGRRTPAVKPRFAVSVVIPAYNHERHVGAAVESVRGQTLPPGELVVVDDGSTDGTHDVLLTQRFDGMRLLRQENRGAHAAINRAVALSAGDYVAILNSDDVFLPERIEHAWAIARSTGAALVVGAVRMIDEVGKPLAEDHPSQRWYREARGEPARTRSLARALMRHNFAVTTSNFFLHRELWRRLGGFGPYRYVHDLDFILRALALCPERVHYAEEADDVLYRVHPHNTILENVPRALQEREALFRALRAPAARIRAAVARAKNRRAVGAAVDAAAPFPPVAATPGASPVRVGLVVRSLDAGGLEEVVALLASSLPAQGTEVHLLCTHAGGRLASRLAGEGVPVTVATGDPADWRGWLERTAPAVLSTHFVDEEFVREASAHGAPILETIHNTYAWLDAAAWERERRKHALLTDVIAVSALVADYYARRVGTRPTSNVIPNGVHPGRLASVPRTWARRHYDLPADAPVFVHLGRRTIQKNLVGLIDSFAVVVAREPRAILVLAGEEAERGYEHEVRRACRRLRDRGSVRILPHQPHVGALLSAADAYVSSSFFEGWSVAASEALWLGLPLILSDCGGSRELVGAAGERGHVVPNPLGDPLEAEWSRVRHPPEDALAAHRAALVKAMLDVAGSLGGWASRRAELSAYAQRELSPERFGGAYARILRQHASVRRE